MKRKVFEASLFILVSIALILTLKCCKPERDKCKNTRYFEQEFLDYWYFPEGSWWVYKRIDTSAEVYDTAVVVKVYAPEIIEDKTFVDYCYEYLELSVTHSNKHFLLDKDSDKAIVAFYTDYPVNTVNIYGMNTFFFGYDYVLYYPFSFYEIESEWFEFYEDLTLITQFDTFYNTIKITDRYMEKDTVTNHVWIKKDVGFVKYHHFDDSVWELVDYEIKD